MRKIFKEKNLLASLLVLVMLLCSFPAVYAEEALPEIAEEVAVEALAESAGEVLPEETPESVVTEDEPAAEPEAAEVPKEVPAEAPEAEEIPEEVPAEEPEAIPEEASIEEPEDEEIPEEAPVAAPENEWEDEQEAEPAEEAFDDEMFIELDDDDAGSVSEELLDEFNNPETYEAADAGVSVEIEMKTTEIRFGGEVTLVAKVSGVDMNHRIAWEANDNDGRGWFTVGSGPEYTFTVTPDIVEREYRAVLFSVD